MSFPRGNLLFKTSRRGLLQTAVLEVEVFTGKAQGGVEYKLSQLGALEDEELLNLHPCIIPGSQITTHDNEAWGRPPEGTHLYRLFLMEPATLLGFNLMNGQRTLRNIAHLVANKMAWPQEEAFALVRGLFLHLVQLRLCLPQGERC